MSLPEIVPPAGTPPFQIAGHNNEKKPYFSDVQPSQGEARRRRARTSAPQIRNVEWFLTTPQMAAVQEWIEEDLLVVSREFSAQVQALGIGRLWYACRWQEQPKKEPLNHGFWRVSGPLVMTGDGSRTPPVLSSFAVEIVVALKGTVNLSVSPKLEVEIEAPLSQPLHLAVEMLIELISGTVPIDARLLEDGDVRITEDGAYRITE